MQEIQSQAFYQIKSMISLNMGNGVHTIWEEAFNGIGLVGELILGKNVTAIYDGAFAGVTGITSLTVSERSYLQFRFAAFDTASGLKNLTIKCDVLMVHGSVFTNVVIAPANIHLKRSVKNIIGMPAAMQEFKCTGATCVCNSGYGNTIVAPSLNGYFNCEPCPAGSTNDPPSQNACKTCGTGSYAERVGSVSCSLCEAGQFSAETAASNASVCKSCAIGMYMPAKGASTCSECPPGNHCGMEGLANFIPCSVGKYTDERGQLMSSYLHQDKMDIIMYYMTRGKLEHVDENGDGVLRAALHLASSEGHVGIVKGSLAAGADKDKADNDDRTPLVEAVLEGLVEVVEMLLAAGADKDKADNDGTTPLISAAAKGHEEIVKMLLAAGADKDKADNDGRTALSVLLYVRSFGG